MPASIAQSPISFRDQRRQAFSRLRCMDHSEPHRGETTTDIDRASRC
jgi:hypothetical protein